MEEVVIDGRTYLKSESGRVLFLKNLTTPNPRITPKAVFERLTPVERNTLVSSTNQFVKQFMYWLSLPGDIDRTNPRVIAAFNKLENDGHIGAGRAAEVLAI